MMVNCLAVSSGSKSNMLRIGAGFAGNCVCECVCEERSVQFN